MERHELVNWFNQVDATYRAEFKDLFELHFSRFDAKLEQRIAELNGMWERRFAEMDVRWERRMAELRVSLIRWMVTLWTAGTLTVLGTALAILKLKP